MSAGRVAVIGGGTSREHEASLASAVAVTRALMSIGYDVESLAIDCDGAWYGAGGRALSLAGAVEALRSCAVALPLVPGRGGEDGTLAALCDLAGVPYVGSGVRASALAMDAWATKLIAEANGLRTAGGTLIRRGDVRQVADLLVADLPIVVKPVSTRSGYGVSLARTRDELQAALAAAFAVDDRVLVEEVVAGRGIDVAVLGRPDGTRIVAVLPEVRRHDLKEAAITIYDALGCAGVARVDFLLTDAGPVLNKVDTVPAFTEHSPVPRLFAAAGIAYAELLERLITDAWMTAGAVTATA